MAETICNPRTHRQREFIVYVQTNNVLLTSSCNAKRLLYDMRPSHSLVKCIWRYVSIIILVLVWRISMPSNVVEAQISSGWVTLEQKLKGVDRCISQVIMRSGRDMGLSYAKEIVSISSAVWAQCMNRPRDDNICSRNRLSAISPKNGPKSIVSASSRVCILLKKGLHKHTVILIWILNNVFTGCTATVSLLCFPHKNIMLLKQP